MANGFHFFAQVANFCLQLKINFLCLFPNHHLPILGSVFVAEKEAYSELMKQIYAGQMVFTGEIEPLKTANMEPYVKEGKKLKQAG